MAELPDQNARVRRVTEIFDELRASGKTDQEIFGEAAEGLKQLARKLTSREPAGASMHATRLLDEVYIKLFEQPPSDFQWETGEEFFLAVARAMHDLKVEYVRRKMAHKRGAGKVDSLDRLRDEGFEGSTNDPGTPANKNTFEAQAIQAFEVDRALLKLRKEYPDREKAIVLTYDGGLTREEAAEALKVSPDKIKKDLEKGRARLRHYLTT
jgi:RNA polymerase sigma factor (TIGR02999 family)